jgi:hypothetical protein
MALKQYVDISNLDRIEVTIYLCYNMEKREVFMYGLWFSKEF